MKKLLLSLVLSMLACVGYAELGASPYEWICDKSYSVTQKTDISVSLGNVSWTQIWTGDNGFYGSRDGNTPISLVFGSNTKPIKSLIFSTDAFAGKEIISITINAKKHTNANTTFAAKIDDIAVGDNKSIGNSFSDIQFSNINKTVSATGKLELIFENSSTATSKNGGVYIHSITIKYTDGGETPGPGLKDATLAFSDASLDVKVGETVDGLKLTTQDTDGDITIESLNPEIAAYDATTGKVTGVAVGTATIKATSAKTETYDEGTATYTVNVSANIPESSIDNPLTVAKALEICAYAPQNVYVRGIVTNIENWTANGGKYYIADAEGAEKLYVYNGQWGADAAGKPADGIISEGATVIVKGNLKIFGSNKIKEFDSNSQLVSYTAPVGPVLLPAGLEFSAAEHTVNVGETVDGLALTKPEDNTGVVTYTSSNDAIATVNAETGAVTGVAAGTVTITATSTETDTYKAGKASYTLTVVDPNAPVVTGAMFDFTTADLANLTTSGIKASNATVADAANNLTGVTLTKDGVTISFADGSQSNNAGGRIAPALSCVFIRATQ
ncbi:MAG: Ig-like domain-containing protein [Muribaculaceae bacterium]